MMKKVALIFIFIILCLFLLLFKDKAYTQQGTTQMDLSKILDQAFLFRFPTYPAFPIYYTPIQWPPLPPRTMVFPTIPTMANYSFLFGNSWYLWQIYNLTTPMFLSSYQQKKPASSKEETTESSTQETTLDSKLKFFATTDKTTFDKAELIEITLMLENNGSEEVIIEFPSEQKFTVMVKDKAGEVVRLLSSDIQDAQPSTILTLQPGETETFYVRWNQEDDDDMIVPSGTYTIDALLSATDLEYQKTVSLNISIGDLPRFSSCKKLKETLKKFWEEIKPPDPSGEDDNSDTLGEPYPQGPVSWPTYAGYGAYYGGSYAMSGLYGMSYQALTPSFTARSAVLAPSYNLMAFAPGITLGISAFVPSYGVSVPAFASSYLGGFGLYPPGFSSAYNNLSPSFFTGYSKGYSDFRGLSGTRAIRRKMTSNGLDGDNGNSNYGHSITNVQVVGVDEADIIKNDEIYIYMIKGNTVQIIQGSPADAMEIVNEISLGDYTDFCLNRLYVMGNTLVLIGEQPIPVDGYYSTPPPGTRIFIYDITDRTNEILARKFIFWGTYVQSRRVGDILYVIMNEPAPLKRFEGTLTDLSVLLPHFYDSYLNGNNEDDDETICDCDEVAYLSEYLSPNYLVVIGIPLNNHTKAIGREVILGKSDLVYATTENLYVTSEYDNDHPTKIYKFWLDNETIVYGSNAQVHGKVINQFSLDEYEDHLRIATTSGSGYQAGNNINIFGSAMQMTGDYEYQLRIATTSGSGQQTGNNIYIFDSGMQMTGSLEDFTSEGSIQSIRFIDDRCYAVIPGAIQPLSVISLTDPTNPVSFEDLDIFSGTYYLQPIDKNRLLGFGRKIVGTAEMGMKIFLYDLTDVSDPQKIGEDEIGSLYTKSEVLTDHRALLLSAGKNLMAFPVTVAKGNGNLPYIFQGAYVYYIDDNGFKKIDGGITHYPKGTFPKSSYDDTSPYHINRIIYMGDYYYAVSKNRITARDILTHTETFSLYLE